MVIGGDLTRSRHVGCATDDAATNLLLLSHAKKMAREIEVPAATNVNQSY
jgi:hypothetical protein